MERSIRRQAGFLLFYGLEQTALVLLLAMFPRATGIIISLFVITFVSTFSIEKILLEQRVQQSELELRHLVFVATAAKRQVREYQQAITRALGKQKL